MPRWFGTFAMVAGVVLISPSPVSAALPPFTSGSYGLYHNGFSCSWEVTVSGSAISGTMPCPSISRTDPIAGTVEQGKSIVVERDCSGAFAGCTQTYTVTGWDGKAYTGQMTGGGGGGPFTLTPATPPDLGPPTVTSSPVSERMEPGQTVSLHYSVADPSGEATVHVNLYDGGKLVANRRQTGPATGEQQSWDVRLTSGRKGPLYYCVWAENAAGKRTPAYRNCKWIPFLVPIAKVSNGCGGEGWDSIVAIENYVGNSGVYTEPARKVKGRRIPARHFRVSFVDACNLHDAGYGGQLVADKINGGYVDFHNWTRKQVDDKFRADMGALCRDKIPASAPQARRACEQNRRYWAVRKVGDYFFDADLRQSGTQTDGPRDNS